MSVNWRVRTISILIQNAASRLQQTSIKCLFLPISIFALELWMKKVHPKTFNSATKGWVAPERMTGKGRTLLSGKAVRREEQVL